MTWNDVVRPPKPNVVRQFGFVCLAVLGIAGLVFALKHGRTTLGYGLIGCGVVCALLGSVAPSLFRWVFTGSMLLAFPIGFVVSQVMLVFLFFVVFLAVGVFLRLRGWDVMVKQRKPAGTSYWQDKTTPTDPKRYLRQY
ncbi:MAG: hypothetical protein JNL97_03325 [Verrucomicrobiales bacterium]|nr:hypothetical protein [Verrucomicrobiales bacterium]